MTILWCGVMISVSFKWKLECVCAHTFTHQLFELSLSVTQLLVHAQADLRALQGRDDLQLSVLILYNVVLQHQAQDLFHTCKHTHETVLYI